MLAIIADIHGNFPELQAELQAVLNRIGQPGCERIISLGDVTGSECPRSRSANDCLWYQRKVITLANLDRLDRSPLSESIGEISIVQAGWQDAT